MSRLIYKEDWDQAKEHYKAWWAHEAFGRAAMAVQAPRKNASPEPKPVAPADPEKKWTDMDFWVRQQEWEFSNTFYGGEAVPIWSCGYPGRENLGVFLGCKVDLGPDTGWVHPMLTGDSPDVGNLRIDPDNRWWRFALKALETGAEYCRGKAFLSTGAFGGSGDTLAWLRGSEQLLLDVMECPDEVRKADQQLMDLWIEVYLRFHAITTRVSDGSAGWFPLWAPGRFYAAQNDFAYMISPKMFREIFLPTIVKQTEFLDHSVYHVDGEGNFNHLDALLELPRLQAYQILPGAGKPSPLHYMALLKKVQAAGKNLHISIPAGEVETALTELSAKGLFIDTWCDTEDEARSLLRKAEKWSHE